MTTETNAEFIARAQARPPVKVLDPRRLEEIHVAIERLALDVFDDPAKFDRWQNRPLTRLGGATPRSQMEHKYGALQIERLLGAAAYGFPS